MTGNASVPGRGRRPKPVAKKMLAGNPGKRAINHSEPTFTPLINCDCPEWLSQDEFASALWDVLIQELCGSQVLCVTDLHNVEVFCAAYSRWRKAERNVAECGLVIEGATGGPIKNPACTIVNESLRQMTTYGSLLGLDPSSRSRLIGGNKKNGNKNPFNDF